jgi:hypothetical protein
MPPFNFGQATGQAFQQSFQATQDRQQEAQRQRAMQRLRKRRLEQNARQARKQRQLEKQRLAQQEEAQEFRQNQAAAESMNQMFQNAREANLQDRRLDQQERRLDLREQRINAQTGEQGVTVTNDDFANMSPLSEGTSVPLGNLPKALQARALQGMMQQPGPTTDVNIFSGEGANQQEQMPGQDPEPPVEEATLLPTENPRRQDGDATTGEMARFQLGEFLRTPIEMFTEPTSAAINALTPSLGQERRQKVQGALQNAAQEFRQLQQLPAQQRPKRAAQLNTQLEQLRQNISTFEQTDQTERLRKNIRGLQRVTTQITPGNPQQRSIRQGVSKLAQKTLQKALEADDFEQMDSALTTLRKTLNQGVTDSQ